MRLLSWVVVAATATVLIAGDAASAEADPRVKIAEKLDVKPGDVKPSPVPGLYEVVSGTEVGYVSTDGRFYVDGDVYDMDSKANLTEARRQAGRVAVLKGVRDQDAIVFSPKGYKYTLNVFTDIDCGYCRKLHTEVAELNRLGVRVRYLMYPRNGPGSEAWAKAEAVWCSEDRNDALTRAKRGESVQSRACKNAVADQYALGQELGIRGTPGIITDHGDYIAGYMPAARLVEHLKTLQGKG